MNADLHAAIVRISHSLAAGVAHDGTLRVILAEARRIVGAATVALAVCDEQRQHLDFLDVCGDNETELLGMRIPFQGSLASGCIAAGRVTYSPKPPALCVPVQVHGETTGALIAVGIGASGSTQDAENAMELFAALVSVELARRAENARSAQIERELSVLYEASRSVAGSLNVQEVLDTILETVCSHFMHHCAAVFLLNDERTHLFIAAHRGLRDDDAEVQLAAADAHVAPVLEEGKARIVQSDVPGEADASVEAGLAPPAIFQGCRTAVIAPIRSRNENLGVLVIATGQVHAYTEADAELLGVVAAQSGIAIANAWLFDDATRRAEEATALYNLSQKVNTDLSPHRICAAVADAALELLRVDAATMMLYNEREGRLEIQCPRGLDLPELTRVRPRTGEGIPGWTYEWVTPTAVADLSADPRNASAPLPAASAICVPVSAGDLDLGVLLGLSVRRRLFTVAEMELLYTVGNLAATALSNALRFEDARAKSVERRRYLLRIARAIGSAPGSWDVPQLLADLAIAVVRADRCTVYTLDDEILSLRAHSGFRPGQQPAASLPRSDVLAGWVVRKGRPLVLPGTDMEVPAAAAASSARDRFSAYLAIPIGIHRRRLGVLEVYRTEDRPFLPDEIRLLSQFVRHAALGERLAASR